MALWFLQAVLLANAILTSAWLLGRVAASDTPRAGVLAASFALIACAMLVLVAVQRRARWAHAVGCLCIVAISMVAFGVRLQLLRSSHAAEDLLGLDPARAGHDGLLGPLLMAGLALWVATSPAVRRYFSSATPRGHERG